MGLMNSKERLLASWRGDLTDHIPLTFQYFGNLVPKHLRWTGAEGEIEVRRYYTVTAGVEVLGPRLADSGVDVLYFVDPLLDGISMEKARDLLGSRMCLVGGANTITLATKDRKMIEEEVRQAVTAFGSSGRFILHPIDALSPDTPWEGIEMLIEAWQKYHSGL
jgi:uroporphyrinogen-III decarboxylase